MLPEGWKRVPLSSVAEVRSGVAKGKAGLVDPISVPYLRVANVQDGHINLDKVKVIEIERHQLERYSLMPGDVLMNEGGDFDKLGRGDVWQGQISPCIHQNHVFSVRPNQKSMTPYFLASLAASCYGKSYFLSCAKRSTNLASINSTQLKEFPVLVPPISEQDGITSILSTWDKAISVAERLLNNSQRQKKALMQELLNGKSRCPGFSGKWQEQRLATICTINPPKPAMPESSRVSFIPMDGVTEDARLARSEIRHYADVSSGFPSFIDGDVLVAKITPCFENGKGAYASNLVNGIGFGSTEFHVLRANSGTSSRLIYHITCSQNFRVKGEMNMQGSAGQKRVTTDYLKSYKISLPRDIREQEKIADILTKSDSEIATLNQKIELIRREKSALMQQLLTGKRRVQVTQKTSNKAVKTSAK